MTNETIKPVKIGISTCLLGQNVRYDGGHQLDRFLTDSLGRFVEYVPVCPEVECGLGIPREAMRLVGKPEAPRLVTRQTGRDYTEQMLHWARRKVMSLEAENLCGFIFNWFVIAGRLRDRSLALNALTLPDFFAFNFRERIPVVRTLSVIVILVAMLLYVAAQLAAAGKAFSATLGGTSYTTGVLIGAAVVLLYTVMGGFRAVCWTDFLQALLMVGTLIVFPIYLLATHGGYVYVADQLGTVDSSLLRFTPDKAGAALFGLADHRFLNTRGELPRISDVWWLVIFVPLLCGSIITLGAGSAPLSKRVTLGVACGVVMGIISAGLATALQQGGFTLANGLAAQILWRAFLYAVFATAGVLLTELKLAAGEQDPEEIKELFDELDELTRAAFADAKGDVDAFLAKKYKIAKEQLRPWHYQNPFFRHR